MLKKLVVTGLGLTLVGLFVAHTSLGSYVSTAFRRTRDTVKDTVPMEFQIDRARNMVKDLEPEIRRSMHVIAKEEVEVASLDERIAAADKTSEKDKGEILQLQADLDTGKSTFKYVGHTYTSTQVKEDLSRRFTRFKTADATLSSMKQMRDARARNLDAARQKLTAMMAAQRQLQVDIENLEAQHKLVQVAEASSDFQFDDSQLANCKELITDIRTKLDVAAKLANADTTFHDEITLEEAASDNVSDQVAEYFKLRGTKDVAQDSGHESAHGLDVSTASYQH